MQLNSKIAVLQNKLEVLGNNTDSDLLESFKHQNERLQIELEEVRSEHKNVIIFMHIAFPYFIFISKNTSSSSER